MELKECITCGSHSFTGNKCDYCGNEYEIKEPTWEEILEKQEQGYVYCDDGTEVYAPKQEEDIELNQILDSFEDKKGNEFAFKTMVWILISIIWFAITVFIPPLFSITICGLIIWICRKVCKKY